MLNDRICACFVLTFVALSACRGVPTGPMDETPPQVEAPGGGVPAGWFLIGPSRPSTTAGPAGDDGALENGALGNDALGDALRSVELGRPSEPAIGSGATLEVRLKSAPEFDADVRVGADGNVVLPLVGSVEVVGLTTSEVEAELRDRYTKHLRAPGVEVHLVEPNGQQVYVGGAVSTPGQVELIDGLSLLEAVMAAGGPVDARLDEVVVVRSSSGRHVGAVHDLRPALRGEAVAAVQLEPRDVIWVSAVSESVAPAAPVRDSSASLLGGAAGWSDAATTAPSAPTSRRRP